MIARNTSQRKRGSLDLKSNAEALGVSRSHLFRVITGQRQGKNLMARYNALKAAQASHPK